jgi:hypothetical protein
VLKINDGQYVDMGLHVSKPAGSLPEAILPEPAKIEGIEDVIVSIDISGASLLTSNVFSSNDLTDIPTVVIDDLGAICAGESTRAGFAGFAETAGAGGKMEKGESGSAGEKTEKGESGLAGQKMEKEESGSAGQKMEKGESGLAGQKMEKGESGSAGEKTEKGESGSAGEKTEKGESGSAGQKMEKEESAKMEKGRPARMGQKTETEEFLERYIFSENDEMEELLKKDESAEKEDPVKTESSDPNECSVCSCLCRRFKQSFAFTQKFQSVYTGLSSELEELYGESAGIYSGINHLPAGTYVPDQVVMINIRKRKNI